MTLNDFLKTLKSAPETVAFEDTISVIDENYEFTETAFKNGSTQSDAGSNNGSCKILSFAIAEGLTEKQTLHCFGDYYRKDVLEKPNGDDHQNIRQFMTQGFKGLSFEGAALKPRKI